MRLWHEELIPKLPRQQLLGQHRECAALRGNGWGRKHSTVNYVFDYSMSRLITYHMLIIKEMKNRGYKVSPEWEQVCYRGKICKGIAVKEEALLKMDIQHLFNKMITIYPEHDKNYLEECIENLRVKGIEIIM